MDIQDMIDILILSPPFDNVRIYYCLWVTLKKVGRAFLLNLSFMANARFTGGQGHMFKKNFQV